MNFIDPIPLIEEVKKYPVLWDRNASTYRDRTKSTQAWFKISNKLNDDFNNMSRRDKEYHVKMVIRKWSNLRDNFTKSIRKADEHRLHGPATPKPKPYIYHKEMSFVLSCMKNRTQNDKNIEESDNTMEAINYDSSDEEPIVKSEKTESEDQVFIEFESDHGDNFNIPSVANPLCNLESLVKEDTDNCRHMSFYRGILPSLNDFNEDETLEFQIGVLKLIKEIKNNRKKSSDG